MYQYSGRAEGRFLAINCAAIPEQLLESELFGHEKGSFTGAERKKVGKFELCNDGTLFLDEIGDMTPLMQTKVLRVLQDQTFERVGGGETIRTNARIIAATNRNLEQAIKDMEFRSDLFYRLNVYTIKLPPLRERGTDISLLANHFLRRFASELGKDVTGIAPDAMKLLLDYHWPGNVRELQSLIKRALLQATAPIITTSSLPENLSESRSSSNKQLTTIEATDTGLDFIQLTHERLNAGSNDIHRELVTMAEKKILAEVLQYTAGNLTQAAKRLGITRTTLRTRLVVLGLSMEHSVLLDEK